jgi:thymidylate synthase (FAD)
MILVKPSGVFEQSGFKTKQEVYQFIERIGRTCYKSESKTTEESAAPFVKMLMKRNHLAVLEHVSLTARFVFDRGVSHELVRHRLAAYAQESTRFCNYKKNGNILFVAPRWLTDLCDFDKIPRIELRLFSESINKFNYTDIVADLLSKHKMRLGLCMEAHNAERIYDFLNICIESENYYLKQVEAGYKPEEARGGLVHFVKTEIVKTANLRSWLHVFSLRTSKYAHPDMRVAMNMLYEEFARTYPEIVECSELTRKKGIALSINAAKQQMQRLEFKDELGHPIETNQSITRLFELLTEEYGEYINE